MTPALPPLAGLPLLCSLFPQSLQLPAPGGPQPDLTPPAILSGPVLTPNPDPNTPLAARIQLVTDEPTRVELSIKDGVRSWSVLAEPRLRTHHQVAVLGVRPALRHEIQLTAIDDAGNRTQSSARLVFDTPPLPDFFPPIQLMRSEPGAMEPGVTFFNATRSRNHDTFLVMVDEAGQVVWFHRTALFNGDAQRISTGNLLFLHGRYGAVELDMFGQVVQQWHAGRLHADQAPHGATLVDANAFHHDIIEMPAWMEADFAVMSSELRVYPDYPSNESDPSQTKPFGNVVGDVIVEFKRDGTVVRETRILDALDPYRIGWNSLGGYWNDVYGLPDTHDWAHGNSILYRPSDDTWIYSACAQDTVAQLRRSDGGLEFLLAPHENWVAPWTDFLLTPVGGPFEWQYKQHAARYTSSGNVILFDNGKQRSSVPDPGLPESQRYSRAVEYRVDVAQRRVEQVWAYGGPDDPWHSPTLGVADELPTTGNVLVCDGDHDPEPGMGPGYARLVEVTRTQPSRVVFELHVRDDSPVQPAPWSTYRCHRLRGVYPHDWP